MAARVVEPIKQLHILLNTYIDRSIYIEERFLLWDSIMDYDSLNFLLDTADTTEDLKKLIYKLASKHKDYFKGYFKSNKETFIHTYKEGQVTVTYDATVDTEPYFLVSDFKIN